MSDDIYADANILESRHFAIQHFGPCFRTFFVHLGSTSLDSLQSDLRLSRALQEHAVRVMQVMQARAFFIGKENIFSFSKCTRLHVAL
jgi:hypothetical protein